MSDHEPTTGDANTDQPAERLDADKVPEEIPDRPIAAFEHGTTEREMAEGESLDDRLSREVPEDQVTTRQPQQSTAPTPILDDADDDGMDRQKDLAADRPLTEPHLDDTGQPRPPAGAEEQAVRIDEADDETDLTGAVDHPGDPTEGGSSRPTDEGA